MHILLALLGAAATIGMILWRLNAAADAAKGLAETAGEARGLFRRWSWQRKFAGHPLDLIEDPREAAAALMVAIAQSDGAMTEAEQHTILAEMQRSFAASPQTAAELLAHARFLTREIVDPCTAVSRLSKVIVAKTTPDERADLIRMLEAVASTNGPAGDIERQALAAFRQATST